MTQWLTRPRLCPARAASPALCAGRRRRCFSTQCCVLPFVPAPLYCTIAHRTAVHHFHATLERALRRRPTVSASVGCSVIRVGNAPPQGEGWTCAVRPLVSQVLCSLTLQLGMVVMVLATAAR